MVVTEVRELIKKVNHVRTSRFLKEKELTEEHFPFPQNIGEEQEQIKEIFYRFIKGRFRGCKIRANAFSLSVRLDGEVNRKALRTREVVMQDQEWKSWFQNNHRDLYRTINVNQNSFRDGYIEYKEKEGKNFIYIPFQPNRIRNYLNNGMIDVLRWLENEYTKEEQVAGYYERVIELMETEVARREQERRERLERMLREYKAGLTDRITKRVDLKELERNGDAVEIKLGHKLVQWALDNGKPTPYTAEVPTYKNVVPIGTDVRIMAKIGSKEEDWFAVPMFDGFELPEGFELVSGGAYGRVTRHDEGNERAREGSAPLVVEDYIFVQFNVDYWKHLFPENYMELVEVTKVLREAAEAEFKAEQEAEHVKLQEEYERLAALEADRERKAKETLEQLRVQIEEKKVAGAAQVAEKKAYINDLTQQLLGQISEKIGG